ncbi:hypothetical protein J6590_004932 [Homalodisca vitripennis]|nr:hypothetical protein J6590_004932 [Homalodisca vitripennis]
MLLTTIGYSATATLESQASLLPYHWMRGVTVKAASHRTSIHPLHGFYALDVYGTLPHTADIRPADKRTHLYIEIMAFSVPWCNSDIVRSVPWIDADSSCSDDENTVLLNTVSSKRKHWMHAINEQRKVMNSII